MPAPRTMRGPRDAAARGRRFDVHVPTTTIVKVLVALVLVAIAIRLWFAFLLFLVAVLIAVTLDPVVRWFQRRGYSRNTGVLAIAIASGVVLAAGVLLILPPLSLELGVLVRDFAGTRDRIEREFPADSPILKALVSQVLALPDSSEVLQWLDRPLIWGLLAVETLSGGVIVLMLALYLLVDGKRAYTWLLSYVPRRHRSRVALTATAVTAVVRSYVRGQCITSLLCGTYTFVLLTVLDVPAALPLALAAAILDIVPILGTVAITALSTTLALTVSPFAAVAVFTASVLYQLLENYVIVPRVYGRDLRLSTLSVILALIVGGLLQGVLGALLVLPLVAAYPIVERIWLRRYLGRDVVGDHAALAASAGRGNERAVEKKVMRGEAHDEAPTPGTPSETATVG